jgi:hypothetical protein
MKAMSPIPGPVGGTKPPMKTWELSCDGLSMFGAKFGKSAGARTLALDDAAGGLGWSRRMTGGGSSAGRNGAPIETPALPAPRPDVPMKVGVKKLKPPEFSGSVVQSQYRSLTSRLLKKCPCGGVRREVAGS